MQSKSCMYFHFDDTGSLFSPFLITGTNQHCQNTEIKHKKQIQKQMGEKNEQPIANKTNNTQLFF